MNKTKQEELQYDSSVKTSDMGNPILGRLRGPCADIVDATRNNRKYSDELWEKVFNNPIVQEYFDNGGIPGELGHPADRQEIDMEKICWMMPHPPVKTSDGKLFGEWDILNTPNGRILKTLCDYGYTMGVSSRGSGETYMEMDGSESVDPDQYEFSCFDAVLLPSVKAARLEYVTESVNGNPSLKQALNEELNKANEDERKLMKETLNNLSIQLEEENNSSVVNHTEVVNEDVAVENNEASLVEQLQTSLRTNKEREQDIIELQEKLSVSYAKEAEMNEKIAYYKKAMLRLSQDSKKLPALQEKLNTADTKVKSLDEQLKKSSEEISKLDTYRRKTSANIRSLKESITTKDSEIAQLKEQLQKSTETSRNDITKLTEQLESVRKDLTMKKTEYAKKLSASNKLVEKYQKIATGAVDRYIDSQALRLGVSRNEIVNRLSEKYTFEEIDTICEDLQDSRLNLSRLPFQSMRLNESKLKARITPQSQPNLPGLENVDDEVDASLLALAGLN